VLRRQLTRKQLLPFLARLEHVWSVWRLVRALTTGRARSKSSATRRG
jgi:hypothetical protein